MMKALLVIIIVVIGAAVGYLLVRKVDLFIEAIKKDRREHNRKM